MDHTSKTSSININNSSININNSSININNSSININNSSININNSSININNSSININNSSININNVNNSLGQGADLGRPARGRGLGFVAVRVAAVVVLLTTCPNSNTDSTATVPFETVAAVAPAKSAVTTIPDELVLPETVPELWLSLRLSRFLYPLPRLRPLLLCCPLLASQAQLFFCQRFWFELRTWAAKRTESSNIANCATAVIVSSDCAARIDYRIGLSEPYLVGHGIATDSSSPRQLGYFFPSEFCRLEAQRHIWAS